MSKYHRQGDLSAGLVKFTGRKNGEMLMKLLAENLKTIFSKNF